jgi:multiple sugar transport system substrate-binding protein
MSKPRAFSRPRRRRAIRGAPPESPDGRRGSARIAPLAALAAVLCAIVLAACGGDDEEGGGAGAGAVEGEISLLAPEYSENTEPFWRDLIRRFESAHPGAKVKLQMVSWTDINQKVTTLISTRQAPDILNLDAYANFAADDLLLPAEEVLSPETQADFIEKFADNGEVDGTLYGIPFVGSVRQLFYNKDVFREAGVQDPPKTWDELRETARKIDATGVTGYGMPLGPEEAQAEFSLFMWGNGGDWVDGETWTVNRPENVEALEFMGQLANQDKVTQPNPGTTNRTDLWKVFGAGKIGMVMGSNFYPVLLEDQNPKLDYGIAPVPVNGGEPVTLGVEDYLMAFNTTEHKPVVKAFLDFVYKTEHYGRFIETEGFLPVTKSVSEQVAAEDQQQKVFIEAVDDARFYPTSNPTWAAIAPQVKQRLGSAVQGKEPADVLSGLQEEAEKGT